MPYSVVDDDTSLQVRATIEYANADDLRNLIVTLQNRLDKMEIASGQRSPDPVQSLSAREPTAGADDGNSGERTPETRGKESDETGS